MILDAIPFNKSKNPFFSETQRKALETVIAFIERKLGVVVSYDARLLPFEREDLLEPLSIGRRLQEKGVLQSFGPSQTPPDEPPVKLWGGVCNDSAKNPVGGGSVASDSDALYAALAEGIERYIWLEESDYFASPTTATAAQMQKKGTVIAPERFVSFSPEQRGHERRLSLDPDARYLWIRGTSLVSGKQTFIPAQTVSGKSFLFKNEPRIRLAISTGLATWPTKSGARLAGALEVIERDAYMIWWFNQLALPRVSLTRMRAGNSPLSQLIRMCERYRLKIHAIQLITDAPAHAVCVVVEDTSEHAPRFTVGIKAHRTLETAIERATLEALRSRIATRRFYLEDQQTPVDQIGHRDRLRYWANPAHARKLEVLLKGEERTPEPAAWEHDSPEQHLDRILAWCRTRDYECVSVSLGTSAKNPTPWQIEMVMIPELQPTHLTENLRQLGGERLRTIPELFGYKPRTSPFLAAPHPFS